MGNRRFESYYPWSFFGIIKLYNKGSVYTASFVTA